VARSNKSACTVRFAASRRKARLTEHCLRVNTHGVFDYPSAQPRRQASKDKGPVRRTLVEDLAMMAQSTPVPESAPREVLSLPVRYHNGHRVLLDEVTAGNHPHPHDTQQSVFSEEFGPIVYDSQDVSIFLEESLVLDTIVAHPAGERDEPEEAWRQSTGTLPLRMLPGGKFEVCHNVNSPENSEDEAPEAPSSTPRRTNSREPRGASSPLATAMQLAALPQEEDLQVQE